MAGNVFNKKCSHKIIGFFPNMLFFINIFMNIFVSQANSGILCFYDVNLSLIVSFLTLWNKKYKNRDRIHIFQYFFKVTENCQFQSHYAQGMSIMCCILNIFLVLCEIRSMFLSIQFLNWMFWIYQPKGVAYFI